MNKLQIIILASLCASLSAGVSNIEMSNGSGVFALRAKKGCALSIGKTPSGGNSVIITAGKGKYAREYRLTGFH
jgi:hypothetical protein